jgi:hypothetical protein
VAVEDKNAEGGFSCLDGGEEGEKEEVVSEHCDGMLRDEITSFMEVKNAHRSSLITKEEEKD